MLKKLLLTTLLTLTAVANTSSAAPPDPNNYYEASLKGSNGSNFLVSALGYGRCVDKMLTAISNGATLNYHCRKILHGNPIEPVREDRIISS